MPALLVAALLGACSSDENLDFRSGDIDKPSALIEIQRPIDGGVIPAGEDFVVVYEVVRGTDGAYVNISVDRQVPVRVNSLKGRHRMDGLPPGEHTLEIVEHMANGQRTGGVARIEFVAQ